MAVHFIDRGNGAGLRPRAIQIDHEMNGLGMACPTVLRRRSKERRLGYILHRQGHDVSRLGLRKGCRLPAGADALPLQSIRKRLHPHLRGRTGAHRDGRGQRLLAQPLRVVDTHRIKLTTGGRKLLQLLPAKQRGVCRNIIEIIACVGVGTQAVPGHRDNALSAHFHRIGI